MECPTVRDQRSIPGNLWKFISRLISRRQNTHRFGGDKPPSAGRGCMT
jgi:hypothetical protein